jgi:hypothetical protein
MVGSTARGGQCLSIHLCFKIINNIHAKFTRVHIQLLADTRYVLKMFEIKILKYVN